LHPRQGERRPGLTLGWRCVTALVAGDLMLPQADRLQDAASAQVGVDGG
jgi:hypothetical protein